MMEGPDLYLAKRPPDGVRGRRDTRLADQMWATQRPFSEEAFRSPSGEPAWKTVRS